MSLPPLPAMKPNGDGGYTFCPKCAMQWGLILLAIGAAVWYYFKNKE